MKKTTIFSLLTGWGLLLGTSSCMNLDEDVYDKLPAEDFGQSKTEINALVGSVYTTLKCYWPSNFMYLSECGGSMAVVPTRYGGDWYDGGQYREIYMHTWTSQTSVVKDSWKKATMAIGTCNYTISIVENSTVLTDTEKAEMIAEIRGVRAFWTYTMLDYWGNIPLVTEYKGPGEKVLPATESRQNVFNWLLTEVAAIADQCPESGADTYGKFTKGAAYTLLAKLYLNADAWGVTTSENNYQKVVECCDKVMTLGYILEPDWKANFVVTNQNSKEAILASCFSSTDTGSDTNKKNELMNQTLHYKDKYSLGGTFSSWNGICAQPDYVKLFDPEDPRYTGSFLIGKQYDKTTGEIIITDHGYDLDHTVEVSMIPGTEYDGTTWGAVNQHDGARCLKWEYAPDLVSAMENDFHIFRLADVYLMKAEALLRGGGSVAEATRLVNLIRERAYGNAEHNYDTVDLDKIQLERRFELAWEGWSRQDDIRFGCFTKGMWASSNCARKTDDYLKLYPVSQDAWQTNPKVSQNPGYPAFSK